MWQETYMEQAVPVLLVVLVEAPTIATIFRPAVLIGTAVPASMTKFNERQASLFGRGMSEN